MQPPVPLSCGTPAQFSEIWLKVYGQFPFHSGIFICFCPWRSAVGECPLPTSQGTASSSSKGKPHPLCNPLRLPAWHLQQKGGHIQYGHTSFPTPRFLWHSHQHPGMTIIPRVPGVLIWLETLLGFVASQTINVLIVN